MKTSAAVFLSGMLLVLRMPVTVDGRSLRRAWHAPQPYRGAPVPERSCRRQGSAGRAGRPRRGCSGSSPVWPRPWPASSPPSGPRRASPQQLHGRSECARLDPGFRHGIEDQRLGSAGEHLFSQCNGRVGLPIAVTDRHEYPECPVVAGIVAEHVAPDAIKRVLELVAAVGRDDEKKDHRPGRPSDHKAAGRAA